MRVRRSYELDPTQDAALIADLRAAMAVPAAVLELADAHPYFRAWAGAFQRSTTIDQDLIDALAAISRQLEVAGLSRTENVALNGLIWTQVRLIEHAIGGLRKAAADHLASLAQPQYPVSETVRQNLVFLGTATPTIGGATDAWLDVWAEAHGGMLTLQLRHGSGIDDALTKTRTIDGWQTLQGNDPACWSGALTLAARAGLLRGYPAMAA